MTGKLDRVIQGDCLEELKRLAGDSVDLAFADPPFNIGYEYDEYDDKRRPEDYLDWSKQWISLVIRVLKPDGTFWLAIGDEYAAELKVIATRELGLTCRNWVVWYYTFGVHCTHKFTRSHAHLFYFVKDPKKFTFNSDAIRVPSARQLVYADKRADPKGRVPDDTWLIANCQLPIADSQPPIGNRQSTIGNGWVLRPQDLPDGFTAAGDTWYFPRVCGTFKERGGFHGCQMPEQLLGRIIKACSNQGELVLDPFAGTGTTLAVAKKLGRRYLGIELSQQYAKETEERLARAKPGDPLDGAEDPLTSVADTSNGKVRFTGTSLAQSHYAETASRARVGPTTSETLSSVGGQRGRVPFRGGLDDLDRGVVEAFRSVHDAFSTDWLLANKELNAEFSDACKRLGLPGSAAEWNRWLIRLRKAGKLGPVGARGQSSLDKEKIHECEFASEIALSQFLGIRLDTILCEPELALRFDELAGTIAPGFESVYYRWAALQLRKKAKAARALAAILAAQQWSVQLRHAGPVEEAIRNEVPSRQGVYLLGTPAILGKGVLYVGETANLHRWLAKRIEEDTFRRRPFCLPGGMQIRFDFLRRAPNDARELPGLQAYIASKHNPEWNYRRLSSDAA